MVKRKLIIVLSLVCTISTVCAQPLWLRTNSISPDGEQIAFTYKGDIYTVSAQGGEAHQLTTNAAYESHPVFSPDGKQIAFASDAKGNADIYLIPTEGGEPRRITTYSATERPLSFSADGKRIYYATFMQKDAQNAQFPAAWISELYTISTQGGRPQQVIANPVQNFSLLADGQSFVYENRTSVENEWRKHHTSSAARDIFRYDANTATHKKLTTNAGEDRNPVVLADGRIAFLSERNGDSFNIYVSDNDNFNEAKQISHFTKHPVRFLSAAKNGTLCYSYHGEIYTQSVDGKAQKVNISLRNDQATEQIRELNVSGGAMAMTPSGDQIVFTYRGEVFATTDKYATTKQITHTPQAERGAVISPDGKTIAYASERSGQWNIYTATIARKEEVNFANATLINEKPLIDNNNVERIAPQFSPCGKELAFVANRNELMVINLETKKVRQITDGSKHVANDDYGMEYEWSPDGKWFAMSIITNVRAPYSDIAIISADGKGDFHNITNSAYIDVSPTWVLDGNAILFASNRYGMRSHASWGSQDDVFVAFVNKDAYNKFRLSKEDYELLKEEEKLLEKQSAPDKKDDKKKKTDKKKDTDEAKKEEEKKDIVVELDKLYERVMRLTPMSSSLSGAMLSDKGDKLYFLSSFEDQADLWEMDTKTRATKIVKKGAGYGTLRLSADGKSLYMLGSRAQKFTLPSMAVKAISPSATMRYDAAAERAYMFDHVFLQQSKRFYREDYHGVDLASLKKDYASFLPHVNNNADFSEMLSEILGELNVSHTGSGYRAPFMRNSDATADLGLFYDLKYQGKGLKVTEILTGGPLDRKATKIKPGVIIEKIDGVELTPTTDYFALLNRKSAQKVLLSLYDSQAGKRWEEVVKPVSKGSLMDLMYKRWVAQREAETERLSGGRLGYVHIESMDDASYRTIYSNILGKYNQYEGVVIDTRFNGGGRLHEDIEILFSGEKYLEQIVRGEKYGDMPSRRYNKPSIMITGEANYSNAHGTPWVYRHKKMGKIVGMPVPGTMTSVNWETLQDPSMYFGIPVVGYLTKEGEYLENSQLEPDVEVVNTPEGLEQGRDEQLECAVKELLKEIDNTENW